MRETCNNLVEKESKMDEATAEALDLTFDLTSRTGRRGWRSSMDVVGHDNKHVVGEERSTLFSLAEWRDW